MPGILINLPYTSMAIPKAIAKAMSLNQAELQLEHWRMVDPYLSRIVQEASVLERRQVRIEWPVIEYPWSPLVADPWGGWVAEITGEDAPAPAILPHTTAGRALTWSEGDRRTIFSRTTQPFYQELEEKGKILLEQNNLVLLITIRSFSAWPPRAKRKDFLSLRGQGSASIAREPQVCIISDPQSTPPGLVNLGAGIFKTFGWWPELNWPQIHGACLPPKLVGHSRVRSIGISLNRNLYLDEKTGRLRPTTSTVGRVLRTVFNLFGQELDRVAQVRINREKKPASPIIKASSMKDTDINS